MLLASSSYPLLDAFWTILEIFFFALWIWLAISVYIDIFRSHDLSGFSKALWVLLILIVPYLGVLIYLIVRGGQMHERSAQAAVSQRAAFDRWYHQNTGSGPSLSAADEVTRLGELRDRGLLTQDEFDREKAKVLARSS